MSPLRMSMDHSDTIPGYDPVARHGRSLSRYSTTSSRATSRSPRSSPRSPRSRQQNPLEIIKLLQEHNDRKGGNSNDIINIFNAMDVGEKEEKRLGGSSSVTPSADPVSPLNKEGFGDNALGVGELKEGLNYLLNTKMSTETAKQVLDIMDTDGDGSVDIREFLEASQSEQMRKKIDDYDWKKQRHLVKPEKRKLIDARRPFAQKSVGKSGRKEFSETSHNQFLQRAYQSEKNRDTFYRPDNVLQLLRDRVKIADMVRTFRNMDIGGHEDIVHAKRNSSRSSRSSHQSTPMSQIKDKYMYGQQQKKNKNRRPPSIHSGRSSSNSSSSSSAVSANKAARAQAFNSLLEPDELAAGINKNLNMDISANEVRDILKIIDTDGDGSLNFSEFVQALRGENVQQYIDATNNARPNHNITRKLFLKSKIMAPKIGSHSWTLANSINHRNETNQQKPKSDNSMIAKFAIRDMNEEKGKCNHNDLGWSGHAILVPGNRGHVNWVGTKRHGRGGPLLGPRIPHHDEHTGKNMRDTHEYKSGRHRMAHAKEQGAHVWTNQPKTKIHPGHYNKNDKDTPHCSLEHQEKQALKNSTSHHHEKHREKDEDGNHANIHSRTFDHGGPAGKPHQGGKMYRSQLDFCFDNKGTIKKRMKEIYSIVAHQQATIHEKDMVQKKRDFENDIIAKKRRYLRHNPPHVDSRTHTEKAQDEILAHFAKRRYRGPSRSIFN